ncbi:alkylated DNA repair protein ALKBH8 homolog isoform X2 [Rutidosis leptorrhynchoides]|uniref:alkylated DNA repair protein ALKBH8 homolog isoform X2 n=1 Tax=Rutidosis leptorrhynchoides TaxID=125765 RepID=UPI003A9A3E81
MEEYKTLIHEAFGDSSEDSDNDDRKQPLKCSNQSVFGENPKWEQIDEIKGLSLCRDFLTPDQQSILLSSVIQGWFSDASHNQAMRFGDLPEWANELSTCMRELVQYSDYDPESFDTSTCEMDKQECIFPSELLNREPLFNQLIVNSYQPGEGICAHVDLMRFEDGIALVSLESSCVMHFSRAQNGSGTDEKQTESKIPVYLTPGSLLLIWGEARYKWKHEINRKPGFQKWDGLEIDQKRRTSITLRKLCNTE